jgi:hypothetical protein
MYESMSESQLRDTAKTRRKKLPTRKTPRAQKGTRTTKKRGSSKR